MKSVDVDHSDRAFSANGAAYSSPRSTGITQRQPTPTGNRREWALHCCVVGSPSRAFSFWKGLVHRALPWADKERAVGACFDLITVLNPVPFGKDQRRNPV